jgi:hypothetical protein
MNKNKTAIAPTYIIIKIIPKKSISNNNNNIAALIKTQIKNKTEYNEFLVIEQQAAEKIKRN